MHRATPVEVMFELKLIANRSARRARRKVLILAPSSTWKLTNKCWRTKLCGRSDDAPKALCSSPGSMNRATSVGDDTPSNSPPEARIAAGAAFEKRPPPGDA
jgi:hypothetical protein